MKPVPELLECDHSELKMQRSVLALGQFNAWFDSSTLKRVVKKSYMLHQGFRCCYCQKVNFSTNSRLWDLEHIASEDDYPEHFTDLRNLAVACTACNNAKRNKQVFVIAPAANAELPVQSADYLIPQPNIDDWNRYLRHTNYVIYESDTPKGQNLIRMCNLSDEAAIRAGQTAQAIDEAIAANFFQLLPNPIMGIDRGVLPGIFRAFADAQETVRIHFLAIRISAELRRFEVARSRKWAKMRPLKMP